MECGGHPIGFQKSLGIIVLARGFSPRVPRESSTFDLRTIAHQFYVNPIRIQKGIRSNPKEIALELHKKSHQNPSEILSELSGNPIRILGKPYQSNPIKARRNSIRTVRKSYQHTWEALLDSIRNPIRILSVKLGNPTRISRNYFKSHDSP